MGKHLGVAYNLRLPQELKDKIAESAKELNRSMNADIVARLEDSFHTTYTAIKHVKTEILLAVLAEKFAEQDCDLKIVKRDKEQK